VAKNFFFPPPGGCPTRQFLRAPSSLRSLVAKKPSPWRVSPRQFQNTNAH
jgi:hypothetical protein